MNWVVIVNLLFPLLLSPLLIGVINKTKAVIAGREGRPLLQTYFDIAKLLRKHFVYSKTTTWVFRAGPLVGLCSLFVCLLIAPLHASTSLFSFNGDFLLFIYLLGLMRFFTIAAAMDTGSSFEGMGANREVFFSFLIEPAFIAIFITMTLITRETNLTAMFLHLNPVVWFKLTPALFFLVVSLFTILLLENARIPFDDPNTHLELTMIHEAMVLDHGGPDLAVITYSSAIKLWIFSALLVKFIIPLSGQHFAYAIAFNLLGVMLVGIIVGLVEASMVRIKIKSISKILVGVTILALLSMILQKGGHV